jgi:predicted heme/steroid binding protein/uncharacterized membrane protein
MKTFTPEELAAFNGQDGKPIYIAHKGKVYDVTGSGMWRGGRHMKRHSAGEDLTTDIQAAPHQADVLERYSQVGVLDNEASQERSSAGGLGWLLDANPFFRRHPHPMTVHFPIAFMLANPAFNLLYWLTGYRAFETTAYHCLGGGLLFIFVAVATGYVTWWYNYMAKMMKPVAIKLVLTAVTVIIAVACFIWRWHAPDVMVDLQGSRYLYFLGSLSFIPLIGIIGWYGAGMTFPLEEE